MRLAPRPSSSRLLLAVLLASPFAAPAAAQNVLVRYRGTVGFNSLAAGPFAGIPVGTPATLQFEVSTPGTVLQPGQYANYAIDLSTFSLQVGLASDTLAGPTNLGIQNDFPVADGAQIFLTGLASGTGLECELQNPSGTMFTSIDITENAGTHLPAIFNSIDWNIFGAGQLAFSLVDFTIFPPAPVTYCTGKTSSLGCVPFLVTSGLPSATATSPFTIEARDLLPGEATLLLYGFQKSNLSFHGGKLCVKAPLTRLLPPKAATAGGAPPCTGVTKRNFQNRIQSGADPLLSAGATAFAQILQRDPTEPTGFGDALTDGVRFVVGP